MNPIATAIRHAGLPAMLLVSLSALGNLCQPVTNAAMAALCQSPRCIDCSSCHNDLEKLFVTSGSNDLRIQEALSALQNNPTAVDPNLLKNAIAHILTLGTCPELRETAERVLALCDTPTNRAVRTKEEEFVLPAVAENVPNVTRGLTDQWVVKKTTAGNTVTFDPATGNIMINQNLASGASVVFNSVTSTGAALTLDAAASNIINIGNTNATAVNIATAGTAATAVSIGTTSTVTDINIGASATTSTIDITGVATVVTGSTSARVDAPTVNIGNTLATTAVNVGNTATTNVVVTGITTRVDGNTTLNLGTSTATGITVGRDALATTTTIHGATLNIGTGATEVSAITIGGTSATSVGINSVTTTVDGNTTLNLGTGTANTVQLGRDNASTVTTTIHGKQINLGTGAQTTGVAIGTGAGVTTLTVGAGATTTNLNVTGATVALTGSTAITLAGTTQLLTGNELRFYNPAGTFYNSIKAGVIVGASPATLVLPLVNGSSGNVLTTNGSGVLSWSFPTPASTSMVDAYRKTSNQTTAAATEVVQFNQADVNPGTAYDPTTTYTYTVPTTGYYWINAQVCVQPIDTGTKEIDLAVGGVAVPGYQSYIVVPILTNSGNPAIYDTRMINFGCVKQLTSGNLVTITYTGSVGDIIFQNASHFSAFLMSV